METITIKGDSACLVTPEGKEVSMSLKDLFGKMNGAGAVAGGIHPCGVRMVESAGPLTVWVYEIPPGIRQLKWIADDSPVPYGKGARYRMVRLALPYVVVLAVFRHGMITDHSECFFRVEPLEDEKRDKLLYPALLNCSKFKPPEGKPLSWICTQKLDRGPVMKERDPRRRMQKGLQALGRCLLETGFNYSSENHEYSSWFSESRGVDSRVSGVDAWQKATAKDPLFVLDVPWLPVGKTVQEVIDRIFTIRRVKRPLVKSCGDLARLMIHDTTKATRRELPNILDIIGETP